MKKKSKRKICFIITSFIHYSRNLLILEKLKKRKDVDLHVVIGGAALLAKYSSRYAHIKESLEKRGFHNLYEAYFNLEGDSGAIKGKTTGLGAIEFVSLFERIAPDLVVLRGDRFEVLAAAIAAANMNIPIAHIEGGDRSGSIDESVRHSITKLAHIHFPTNEQARKRIIRMGEKKEYVFNFGSPDIEVAHRLLTLKSKSGVNNIDVLQTGSGARIDLRKNFLMVMYHPVTTEISKISKRTKNLLGAIYELNIPTLWFWPNFDAGAEKISNEIRIFNDTVHNHTIRFMRYLPPETFLNLLKNTSCLVGNSSAGIKECSYMGVPVVDISTRQNHRLHADNVLYSGSNKLDIKKAIRTQLANGKYKSSPIYYRNNTSKQIVDVLATIKLYNQKEFRD